jgi:hypothetical protein
MRLRPACHSIQAQIINAGAPMLAVTLVLCTAARRPSEVWTREQEDAAGIVRERVLSLPPRHLMDAKDLPDSFSWGNQNGKSLVTKSLNQHIPQ